MKTPERPTRLQRADDVAAHLASVLPWGAVRGRMAVEQAVAPQLEAATTVRRRLRQRVAGDYPEGKAQARQAYFMRQRNLPGDLAVDGQPANQKSVRLARARAADAAANFTQATFKAKAKAPSPLWHEIGPTLIPRGQTYGQGPGSTPSVSGRCCGVMVDSSDPMHVIACSAGGGLWGTHDGGATWTPLTDLAPTLVMGAIAQSPSAPGIVYAATGDGDGRIPYGVGLMRSSDGGKTWDTVSNIALHGTASYDLAIDPLDPLTVWIATDRGLYVTRNGGDTAQLVLDDRCWSVSIHPGNTGELLAAQSDGLKRSTTGGASWKRIPLPGAAAAFERLEAAHAPGNGDIVYVAGAANKKGMVWRRATATGAFSAMGVPASINVGQAWYDWCIAVSPADADVVFLGAIDMYRGDYAGGAMRWSNVSSRAAGDSIHPDQHFLAFDPTRPQTVYACNDGGVYRSPDLGASWVSLNPGLGITEFEYLAQLASDATWLIGGTQDNGTLSLAGSRRWDQVALGDGGDCASVDRNQDSICYHSYYDMDIERALAHDPGAFGWADISPPVPPKYSALFYPPLDARGSHIAKAGTSLWVSGDEGGDWHEVKLHGTAGDVATALAFIGDDALVVGMESGQLWGVVRKGAGASWSKSMAVALGAVSGTYVSDICALPGATALWVTCSALGGPHVFMSTDGGRNFSDSTGNLPDLPVNSVVADSKNKGYVYIGTDRGVFRTTDSGKKWSDFSNGLPHAIIGALVMHGPTRRLRVGTRNRGAWEVQL